MVLYQLAFAKCEINRFWLNFFQFPWNILDLNYGEFAKKSSITANWGWWLEIVDVTLFDILEKVLSIKVEEKLEILVGINMREDVKLDESVSTKLLRVSYISNCSKSMLKSRRSKVSFEFFY